MLSKADAKHAVELFDSILRIDLDITRAEKAHTIKVEASTGGNAERVCVCFELAEHSVAVRNILVTELRALRALRCRTLHQLGFATTPLFPDEAGAGKGHKP